MESINSPKAVRPAEGAEGGVMQADEENPTDDQLTAAGFDLADDLDRPDRHCDCEKCKAFGSPDSRVERGVTMKSQKTDSRVESDWMAAVGSKAE